MSAGKEPTRIGVVGCGTIAYWTHLRVLARMPNVQLIAAADPDREARSRAAALVKTELHEHAEELLARPDLDAVVLCPATPAHAEVALAACRHRIPFYIEKPLATSAAEARAILDARDQAGVVAAVGFNRRHHPVFERARTLLASGRIGRVRSVLSAFCEPVAPGAMAKWKQHRATGGGVLLDLGSHHIDLVRWLLDDEIATVEARLESDASEDDSAWLRLATRGATEVRSTFSFRSGPADWLCFLGERGSLLVDRFRAALELRTTRRFGYGLRKVHLLPQVANVGWRLRRVTSPSYEPSYARALAAFVGELRGAPQTTARLADGARNLAVVLAAEQAAHSGRAIDVDGELDANPARD